ITQITDNALAEDVPQKTKPESCRRCRYDAVCTGVWRTYADVYGLDELVPIPGEAIATDDDLATVLGVRSLRPSAELAVEADAPARVHLEVLDDRAPLRVVLVGTGARALRLVAAAKRAKIDVVAVAS